MLAPVLALAMMQTPAVTTPPEGRGTALYQDCVAMVAVLDKAPGNHDYEAFYKCNSYIRGFVHGVNLAVPLICTPSESTLGTLARVYVLYMQKNPRLMEEPMTVGLVGALLEAYPCPAAK